MTALRMSRLDMPLMPPPSRLSRSFSTLPSDIAVTGELVGDINTPIQLDGDQAQAVASKIE